jgi:hypothetical protein
MAYNWAVHGVFDVTHATGEVLITHTTVYGRGRYVLAPVGPSGETSAQLMARRLVIAATEGDQAKARTMYGPRLTETLMREVGVSEATADDLLRDLAIQQIAARPLTYLALLSENVWRIFAGRPADLEYAWQSSASASWGPSLPLHPRPASDGEDAWLEPLSMLMRIYDPAHLALPLAGLFILGLSSAVFERRSRLALLPALSAIVLLLAGAALVGTEYRFRYPTDPLITVVGIGGLRWLGRQCKRAQRRVGRAVWMQDALSGRPKQVAAHLASPELSRFWELRKGPSRGQPTPPRQRLLGMPRNEPVGERAVLRTGHR